MAERPWHEGRRAQQDESKAALQLRQECVQTTTSHRECLLPPQGLPSYRNTLRQAGQKLARLDMPRRRRRMVDFMSLGPSLRRPKASKQPSRDRFRMDHKERAIYRNAGVWFFGPRTGESVCNVPAFHGTGSGRTKPSLLFGRRSTVTRPSCHHSPLHASPRPNDQTSIIAGFMMPRGKRRSITLMISLCSDPLFCAGVINEQPRQIS